MDNRRAPLEFDAFGEQTPAMRFGPPTPGERRARRFAMAVFWSLAVTLIAGRVHFAPALDGPTMTLAAR